MKKKAKPPIFKDRYFSYRIVLKEVWQEFQKQKDVSVIIGFHESKDKEDVLKYLSNLKIKVMGKGTDRYLFASITESQADKIEKENTAKADERYIDRVWLDKKIKMTATLEESEQTICAGPAKRLFQRCGEGIVWAVVDTGVRWDHEWLVDSVKKGKRFDYTGGGKDDENGHGTHVAGIICRIAPKVTIYSYRVLDKDGSGNASSIIQAMYDIRKLNFEEKKIVVHGVNLSVGGPVEAESFGCGATPLCEEANSLMLSGVIVCVAAGNDGYKKVVTANDQNKVDFFDTYLDIGISDPGNAQEVITVGSVHSLKPHTHGISYFSSKGPTGDGRCKPDVVAPGEKIISAYHTDKAATAEMSGTSMATPHVSGALALFLSIKPEFIGFAKEVKQILMKSCTDLGRDRYFQGAGLVDTLRMIQAV
jgi:subtilisin family serine protease